MSIAEFDRAWACDELHTAYSCYVMDHGDNSVYPICNGDQLLSATESGYLFEEFKRSLVGV